VAGSNDKNEDFTIGVEEEYQIVDPTTRELRQKGQRGQGRKYIERIIQINREKN